jgi:hypothetical protein
MKSKSLETKYKDVSFADVSTKISKKYKNRDLNKHDQNSFLVEMRQLMMMQEKSKLAKLITESIDKYRKPVNASKYAKGGMLPKYGLAGTLPTEDTLITTDNVMQSGFTPLPLPGFTKGVTQTPITNPPVYNANVSGYMQPNTGLPILHAQPGGTPNIQQGVGNSGSNKDGTSWLGDNIYAPLMLGKGIEVAGKLAMLAGGYDKVAPEYNPYESDIRRKMSERSIDLGQVRQQIAGATNAGMINTGNVRSEAVRQSLAQNIINSAQGNLANTSVQQQQINNGYRGEEAQTLNNLGQQRVQANNYAEQLNQQSKGNYQLGLQNMLETAGNAGQRVTDYRANVAQQNILASVLETNNFKMGDAGEIINKANSGAKLELDDFIKLAESNGADAQTGTNMFLEYRKKYLGASKVQ